MENIKAPSSATPPKAPSSAARILYCSFCGKSEKEVTALIAGPSVYTCDECVEIFVQLVDDRRVTKTRALVHIGDERAVLQGAMATIDQLSGDLNSLIKDFDQQLAMQRVLLETKDKRLAALQTPNAQVQPQARRENDRDETR